MWLREAGCPGQGPDVRAGPDVRGTSRMSGVPEPGRTPCNRWCLGKNSVDFSDEIQGKVEEKLDPHVAQQIHGTNSTKSCQINRSQKIFGALFVGQFSKLGRTRQKQARKRSVGLQNREKPLLLIPYDTGWNPNQRIFHVWRLAHDEHGENTEKDGENTRENTQINTEAITQVLDSRYKVEIHDPKSTTVIQIVFSWRRSWNPVGSSR